MSTETPSPQDTKAVERIPLDRMVKGLVRIALYVGIVYLYLLGIGIFGGEMVHHAFNTDLPWLMESGRYILKHQQLPMHDIFSWTQGERPWMLYQWLFEVGIAKAADLLGNQGLVRAFTLFAAGLYLMLPLLGGVSRKIPALFHVLICPVVLIIIGVNFSLRPMMVSSLFLAMQYLLLLQVRRGRLTLKQVLAPLAVTYLLWGNMHTGVTLGFFSLAIMAAGDWLEQKGLYPFQPTMPEIEGKPLSWKIYTMLLLLGFVASLVNPYGFGIYTYVGGLSSQKYMNDTIIELQSPNFHWTAYQFYLGLLALFILLMPWARRVFSAQELIHMMVLTFTMLYFQRFVVWTGLFYALILPKALTHWSIDIRERWPGLETILREFERLRPTVIAITLAIGAMYLIVPQNFPKARLGSCGELSKGITAYHKLRLPTDRVLTDAEVGSCTIMYYPQTDKVFIDTRFDFYGSQFMRDQRQAMHMVGKVNGYLLRWDINTVVMRNYMPLVKYLENRGDFQTLYHDKTLVVLRKTAS
jgi:hypothetical protein